eukprot:3178409-Prymnesium_polylepis.1
MACAQNAASRDVSQKSSPLHDLNHCRVSSTSVMRQKGTPNSFFVVRVMASNARSSAVSSIPESRRASIRLASFGCVGQTPGLKPCGGWR